MIINDKRALAYVQTIASLQPIDGADNIELAHVAGWTLIVKKGEFQPGEKCVYFEIDSKLPEEPRYEFLRQKHFIVRTYKLNKFGVVSQGLALPLGEFPELDPNIEPLTDLTETLKVTYSVKEDNERKSQDPRIQRFKLWKAKHPKFFSSKFGKFMMRRKWFAALMLRLHGGPATKKYAFPKFVSKTDEERVQNMPEVLQIKTPFIVTEKIDGTSLTCAVERKPFGRFEIYVCSRNVRFANASQKAFMDNDNIYWEMTIKYKLIEFLKDYLKKNKKVKWACIQGECYGKDWQGNPLKLEGHELAVFNFKDSLHDDPKHFNGRIGSIEGKELLAAWGIPWVPIIHTDYVLPDTVDELIEAATGPSSINPKVLREGWVLRAPDGNLSFKAVSTTYLLKKKE